MYSKKKKKENRAKKGFSFEYTSLLTPGGEPLLSKDGWMVYFLAFETVRIRICSHSGHDVYNYIFILTQYNTVHNRLVVKNLRNIIITLGLQDTINLTRSKKIRRIFQF